MNITMSPNHSELGPGDSEMRTQGQTSCASIIVMWEFANGVYGQVRGQHSPGGNEYDAKIWKGVPNSAETVVVVVPGSFTDNGSTTDLNHVKDFARANRLTRISFSRAPSGHTWSINRRGQLFVNGRPFRVVPSKPGPSSPGPSSPRSGGSGKRSGGH